MDLPTLATKIGKVGQADCLPRPVGLTCPDCPFLGNGCYAEAVEARWKNARKSAMQNRTVNPTQIANAIRYAARRGRALRLHDRGDFGNGSKMGVDRKYVAAVRAGLKLARGLTKVWAYTHVIRKSIASLNRIDGVTIYASIHNESDLKRAQATGFDRFALAMDERKPIAKRQVISLPVWNGPQFIHRYELRWLVCPAQYNRSNKKVVCSDCRWCIDGKGHVAFLRH